MMNLTNLWKHLVQLAALSLASIAPWWLLRNEHSQGSAPLRFEGPAAGGRGCSLRRPGANPCVGREGPGGHLTWRKGKFWKSRRKNPSKQKNIRAEQQQHNNKNAKILKQLFHFTDGKLRPREIM